MERRPLDARALADREEIRDVLARYARAIDRLDVDLLKSCYHPDSYDDHGHFKGNGHEFADFIVESLRGRCHATSHVVTNILIELDPSDHDRATGESYATSYLRRTGDDGREWLDVFAGRYLDVFERRGGEWRFASRVVVHDWSLTTPIDGPDAIPIPMEGFAQGRHGPDDPVYDL